MRSSSAPLPHDLEMHDTFLDYMRWWESGPEFGGKPALRAYKDGKGKEAKWTIGYGFSHEVLPFWVWTEAQAEENLRKQLQVVESQVRQSLPGVTLAPHQWDALVSLVYNIGISRFRTSSPRIMVQQGKLSRVGLCMQLWNKQMVNGVLVEQPGLTKRRAADRAIWEKGDYSGRP